MHQRYHNFGLYILWPKRVNHFRTFFVRIAEASKWRMRQLIFVFSQALEPQFGNSRQAMSFSIKGMPQRNYSIIQSGEVEIRLGNRVLEKLSNYNFFGEMALIDSTPRSATAVAITDVKLVPVGEKQFLFLVSNTPYFALNVMRILARRLRTTNNTL